MTLEAWVYPTVNMTDWSTALVKENPSHGLAYGLYANSDTSRPAGSIYIGGDKNLLGGPWLLANTWVHLATTYNGSTQLLYVNGTEVASRAQSGSIEVSNGALRIGGNSLWGEFFQGRIDDVRVYNRALSATQVNTDMNSP
ncbi:MAG: LamG domain-containing protein [Pseudomonadota bacterium]|nr:LamG domain-containing protein [Pseudomonadota bacterium]